MKTAEIAKFAQFMLLLADWWFLCLSFTRFCNKDIFNLLSIFTKTNWLKRRLNITLCKTSLYIKRRLQVCILKINKWCTIPMFTKTLHSLCRSALRCEEDVQQASHEVLLARDVHWRRPLCTQVWQVLGAGDCAPHNSRRRVRRLGGCGGPSTPLSRPLPPYLPCLEQGKRSHFC